MPALKTGGRPRSVPWQESGNGVLSGLRPGCTWRSLPLDPPACWIVYPYFRLWLRHGTWAQLHDLLREPARPQDPMPA